MEITREYRKEVRTLVNNRKAHKTAYSFRKTDKGTQLLKHGKFIRYVDNIIY